jgi:hypothetical protein
MDSQTLRSPDPVRSRLRSAVKAVDCEMSHLKQVRTEEHDATTDRLIENWGELVDLLALGPEPEYRTCPFCGNIGMRSATRCGHCWEKLQPFVS